MDQKPRTYTDVSTQTSPSPRPTPSVILSDVSPCSSSHCLAVGSHSHASLQQPRSLTIAARTERVVSLPETCIEKLTSGVSELSLGSTVTPVGQPRVVSMPLPTLYEYTSPDFPQPVSSDAPQDAIDDASSDYSSSDASTPRTIVIHSSSDRLRSSSPLSSSCDSVEFTLDAPIELSDSSMGPSDSSDSFDSSGSSADNKSGNVDEDDGWLTWTSSPPRPIPALHGPAALPYARCPSGAEGTIIEEPSYIPQVIWGLGANQTVPHPLAHQRRYYAKPPYAQNFRQQNKHVPPRHRPEPVPLPPAKKLTPPESAPNYPLPSNNSEDDLYDEYLPPPPRGVPIPSHTAYQLNSSAAYQEDTYTNLHFYDDVDSDWIPGPVHGRNQNAPSAIPTWGQDDKIYPIEELEQIRRAHTNRKLVYSNPSPVEFAMRRGWNTIDPSLIELLPNQNGAYSRGLYEEDTSFIPASSNMNMNDNRQGIASSSPGFSSSSSLDSLYNSAYRPPTRSSSRLPHQTHSRNHSISSISSLSSLSSSSTNEDLTNELRRLVFGGMTASPAPSMQELNAFHKLTNEFPPTANRLSFPAAFNSNSASIPNSNFNSNAANHIRNSHLPAYPPGLPIPPHIISRTTLNTNPNTTPSNTLPTQPSAPTAPYQRPTLANPKSIPLSRLRQKAASSCTKLPTVPEEDSNQPTAHKQVEFGVTARLPPSPPRAHIQSQSRHDANGVQVQAQTMGDETALIEKDESKDKDEKGVRVKVKLPQTQTASGSGSGSSTAGQSGSTMPVRSQKKRLPRRRPTPRVGIPKTGKEERFADQPSRTVTV